MESEQTSAAGHGEGHELTLGEVIEAACKAAERITPVPELAAELATYLVCRALEKSDKNAAVARRLAAAARPRAQ